MQAKQLKVLLVTARSDIGGGPRHLWDLAQGLHQMQVASYIASPNEEPYGPLFQKLAKLWIEIPHRSFSLLTAWQLLRTCRRERIDIIHSHGRGAGIYSRFLGIFGFKVVHTWHGFHVHKGLLSRVKLVVEKLLFPFTDIFIAVSQDEANRAIRFGVSSANKIRIIFNGIQPKPRQINQTHFAKSKFIFASLTRFDPQKGNDLLVNLVAKLPSDTRERVEFRIAGTGDQFQEIKNLVESRGLDQTIKLVGSVSNPAQFLEQADAYISCSRGEGLSYASLEALNAGRPLLLSDVDGHRELLEEAGVILFDLQNPEDFQQAMKKITTGAMPKPTLPERFQVNKMCENILLIYKALV